MGLVIIQSKEISIIWANFRIYYQFLRKQWAANNVVNKSIIANLRIMSKKHWNNCLFEVFETFTSLFQIENELTSNSSFISLKYPLTFCSLSSLGACIECSSINILRYFYSLDISISSISPDLYYNNQFDVVCTRHLSGRHQLLQDRCISGSILPHRYLLQRRLAYITDPTSTHLPPGAYSQYCDSDVA